MVTTKATATAAGKRENRKKKNSIFVFPVISFVTVATVVVSDVCSIQAEFRFFILLSYFRNSIILIYAGIDSGNQAMGINTETTM